MKPTHIIVRNLMFTLAIGALVDSAVVAAAGSLQEFGRDSVYARGAVRSTPVPTVAGRERFGRSSVYVGDVGITPWKDNGRLPSSIAGNGRSSVYAMPVGYPQQHPVRVARESR
jgi:hypothetical protein